MMIRLTILLTFIILLVSSAFSQVGTLTFCPDTTLSNEDSLWVIEQAETNTPRDSLTIPPQILEGHTPQPVYPDSALKAGIPAQIIVAAYVSWTGEVMAWQPLRIEPQGWGFERAVEKVICEWKFTPATRQGQPVNATIGIPFNFQLESDSSK